MPATAATSAATCITRAATKPAPGLPSRPDDRCATERSAHQPPWLAKPLDWTASRPSPTPGTPQPHPPAQWTSNARTLPPHAPSR